MFADIGTLNILTNEFFFITSECIMDYLIIHLNTTLHIEL